MNQYAIYQLIWTNVAVPVNGATGQMIPALMAIIGRPLQLCAIAYFIITAMIAGYSPGEEAMMRFLKQLGVAAVVYTVATNATSYNYYVSGVVQWFVDTISKAMAGAFGNTAAVDANAFDVIQTRAFSVGLAVYKNIPFSLKAIPLGMAIVTYWFLSAAAIILMFSVYLVSYVATAVLVGIGPIFVALFAFPYTRGWFDGWLRNVVTGILVQIFTVALGSIFIQVLGTVLNLAATGLKGSQVGEVDGGLIIGELMMLVVTALACLIFGILSLMMIRVAESIAGGVHSEVSRLGMPRFPRGDAAVGGGAGGSGGGSVGASGGSQTSSQAGTPSASASGPPRSYAFQSKVGGAP